MSVTFRTELTAARRAVGDVRTPAMTSERLPVRVVRLGEGRMGDLGDMTIEFKVWGADTGGAFAIVEHEFPPGALVPAPGRHA